jgi:hypothetical protein
MLRFFAGAGSALFLVLAGFFIWKGQAEGDSAIPPPPRGTPLLTPLAGERNRSERPPEASEKSKEEKRFARADKDKDGRITLDELYLPRRKAFAKLDRNGDGRLAFEEWAASTAAKFAKTDADHSGWLSPKEYEASKPKPAKPKKCAC